jgi:hypothetical protein
VILTITPTAGSDAAAHLASLGLNDPSRYVTLRQMPIFDAHQPIKKKVHDPSAVSPENPDGLVWMPMGVSPDDLKIIAANTNRAIETGRLPLLKIGHTPLEQRPEHWQPKPIGMTSNYSVCLRDGHPWLCCDLHYRRDLLTPEVASFPNISVERIGMDDPALNAIRAVSLLRREPERPVPFIPYAAEPSTLGLLACYGRDVPAPSPYAEPSTAEMFEFALRSRCFDPLNVRRRLLNDKSYRTNYAAENAARLARSAPVTAELPTTGRIPMADDRIPMADDYKRIGS